ncbi:HAD family hydrolase [candidate division CSSED10-310 bacterium]|uniref:HAD family hydrolase n=1 Tax=candidate division CSSED10-310 bacterium TaxID=2855610 RepID=A0ABV6YVW8_UNCC1
MVKLLLFDIDGTLISSGGAGTTSMTKAFHELFLIPDGFRSVSMAGNTDPLILQEALSKHGLKKSVEKIKQFQSLYFALLQKEIEKPCPGKRIMPGIVQILENLQNNSSVVCGLLTGNWRGGAMIKLSYFKLASYFSLGAFADDSPHRQNLVPFAMKRVKSMIGQDIVPENIYVIGDTPLDIACATPHAVKTIAVATGSYSLEQLLPHKPDLHFPDFSKYETFLDLFKPD